MALSLGPNLGQLVHGDPGEEHYTRIVALYRALDALVQPRAKSMSVQMPPESPADGDCYIVPAGATDAWASRINQIARWSNTLKTWEYYTPKHGWQVALEDVGARVQFIHGVWTSMMSEGEIQFLARQVGDAVGGLISDMGVKVDDIGTQIEGIGVQVDTIGEHFRESDDALSYFNIGDGYGFSRWQAYNDGSYGTHEALIGPAGLELSDFSLQADQSGDLVIKDAWGYYAQRGRFTPPTLTLEDGVLLAVKDPFGFYSLCITETGFSSQAAASGGSGNSISSEQIEQAMHRIDDVFDRPRIQSLQVISHRGFSLAATENTMLAFSTAAQRGAKVIEIDVLFSLDRVPFINHDDTADRLMTQVGSLAGMTAAEIDALQFKEWQGTPLAGAVRIPRYSEYLQFAAERGIHTIVDIKKVPDTQALEHLVDMADAMGLDLHCTYASFTYSELVTIRQRSPRTRICYLGGNANDWKTRIDACRCLRADYAPEGYVLVNIPEAITYARQQGVSVSCWTIDNIAMARQLQRLGVNRIYSNLLLEVPR